MRKIINSSETAIHIRVLQPNTFIFIPSHLKGVLDTYYLHIENKNFYNMKFK